MKKDFGSKIFIGLLFVIVLAISLVSGFLIKVTATYENAYTMWLVGKIVVSIFLVLQMVIVLLPKASFSTSLPTTITVLVFQFVPLIARINFKSSTPVIIIYLVMLLLFVLFYGVRTLSNRKFLEDQNRAKHSSNYQG